MDKRNINWFSLNCPRIPLFPPIKECEGILSKIVIILLYCGIYTCCILGLLVIGVISYLILYKL